MTHQPLDRDAALIDAAGRLCDTVARIGGPGVPEAVAAARAELSEPALRLAVVGRVKAGKSTLVNAVVGRRVAPTDEAECTRVVTQYRYGAPERGEIHLLDGTVEPFALENGGLPRELSHSTEAISHVVVHLQQAVLRDLTLVDTPGLATTTAAHEAATRRALLEAGLADALVYVFRDVQRADDVALLREYAQLTGRATGRPQGAGSIGVLSHADTFGEGPWGSDDPLEAARAHAAEIAERRRAELGTVVPVSGRLAEIALTGGVTERVTRDLAALADADDVDLRFPADDVAAQVDRVAAAVGDLALRHGRAAAQQGSRALQAWMLERSHHRGLIRALQERYLGRTAPLKARSAVQRLQTAANAAGAPYAMAIHEAVSEATGSAAMQPLEELHAWEELHLHHPDHPAERELDALLSPRGDAARLALPAASAPEEVRAEARRRSVAARQGAALATDRVLADAYRALSRSYGLIAARYAEG